MHPSSTNGSNKTSDNYDDYDDGDDGDDGTNFHYYQSCSEHSSYLHGANYHCSWAGDDLHHCR
jgi:hypothetical protein